jgi:hypothetical protein
MAHNPRRDTSPHHPAPPIVTDEQIADAMARALDLRCHRGIDRARVESTPLTAEDAMERTEQYRRNSWDEGRAFPRRSREATPTGYLAAEAFVAATGMSRGPGTDGWLPVTSTTSRRGRVAGFLSGTGPYYERARPGRRHCPSRSCNDEHLAAC